MTALLLIYAFALGAMVRARHRVICQESEISILREYTAISLRELEAGRFDSYVDANAAARAFLLAGHGMTSMHQYEATLHRKPTMNDAQNVRKKIAYVQAASELDAKIEAERKNPAFRAVSAKAVF